MYFTKKTEDEPPVLLTGIEVKDQLDGGVRINITGHDHDEYPVIVHWMDFPGREQAKSGLVEYLDEEFPGFVEMTKLFNTATFDLGFYP